MNSHNLCHGLYPEDRINLLSPSSRPYDMVHIGHDPMEGENPGLNRT